jgi:dolichol-phosphate mannosyltransferase
MKLSLIIPVRDEERCVVEVVDNLRRVLLREDIPYEIVIVNDHSTDSTPTLIQGLARADNRIKVIETEAPYGFGLAIRKGLEICQGEVIVIFMGDNSDSAEDAVVYYRKILQGYDCVFGSRFIKGSCVVGYPKLKLILNRLGNALIQLLFFLKYNDISNAFKAYRRKVIDTVKPLVSQHFNITVDLPLKAIVRGFSYAVVPISWDGRLSGVSKYHIRELSRKYLFSIFYVWLEKILLSPDLHQDYLRCKK